MLEGNAGAADNPQATADPVQPTQQAATTPQGADSPDKFAGQSREQVVDHYKELEKRAFRAEAEKKEFEEFTRRVQPYFKVDDKGVIDFDREVLQRMVDADQIGPSTGQADNPTANTTEPTTNNSEVDLAALQENPKAFMEMLKEQIRSEMKSTVEPLQQIVFKDRNESWVNEMKNKHPDFDQWRSKMGEYLTKSGATVHTKTDLENAYLAAKAIGGGFVDAKQYKDHTSQLMATLQDIKPGAGQVPVDESKVSNKALLGMEQNNTNATSQLQELFGKDRLAAD